MSDADATRTLPPEIEVPATTQQLGVDDSYVDEPEQYAVEGQIGAGGMGMVLAAKGSRLGRPVALKVVMLDRDDLRRRFERETRVTARLQHPAIVPVYGAGRGKNGQPFYAMKHVTGEPLDQVIAKATTLDKRIALLPSVIAVTEAIAYAHAERIIHRDLKPANILVGAFGETVVIDWGLAKDLGAADDDGAEASETPFREAASADHTARGKIMGTPSYMPLEQARGEPVDPRADVYALGAILYHVLSGSAPYRHDDDGSVPWETMLARVLVEPPVPLEQIQSNIPPDLLAIVARAMARSPGDRYPSAGELAADLKRFQTGQLVGAHRYSTWQLVARWLRRHRAAVTVAAVLVAVLAAVSVVSVQRIRRERSDAEEARALADQQRALAVESRGEAEDLMGFMLGDLKDKLKPLGKLDILGKVADKTMAYYRKHPADASDADRRKRAQAYFNVGEVFVPQGNLDGALDAFRSALAIRKQSSDPLDAAVTHYKIGDVLETRGDTKTALAEYRAGLALAERAATDQPGAHEPQFQVSYGHSELGDVLRDQGDAAAALEEFTTASTLADKLVAAEPSNTKWLRQRAVAGLKRGLAFVEKNDLAKALAADRDAIARLEKIVEMAPDTASFRVDLSGAHGRLGDVLRRQGKIKEALAEYRAGLAIAERMAVHDPTNTDWQRNITVARIAIGDALIVAEDRKGAVVEFRAAGEVLEKLVPRDSTNAQWRRDLMVVHNRTAQNLGALKQAKEALAEAAKARVLVERLQKDDPENLTYLADDGSNHEIVGNIHYYQETVPEVQASVPEFEAAIAIWEKLAAKQPKNREFQRKLAIVLDDLATSYGTLHDARAIDMYARILPIYQAVLHDEPSDLSTLSDELVLHMNLNELYNEFHRGDPKAELHAAREIADKLLAAAPDNATFKQYADAVAKREAAAKKGAKP